LKEIKIRPRIAEHDLLTKIRNVRRLLPKDRVKVSVTFRGREITHADIGDRLLDRVVEDTKDISKVEARFGKGNIHFVVLVSYNGETLHKVPSR
jgi:translation initiation factor IF-3